MFNNVDYLTRSDDCSASLSFYGHDFLRLTFFISATLLSSGKCTFGSGCLLTVYLQKTETAIHRESPHNDLFLDIYIQYPFFWWYKLITMTSEEYIYAKNKLKIAFYYRPYRFSEVMWLAPLMPVS